MNTNNVAHVSLDIRTHRKLLEREHYEICEDEVQNYERKIKMFFYQFVMFAQIALYLCVDLKHTFVE